MEFLIFLIFLKKYFIIKNNNFTNSWEYFGSSKFINNSFYLLFDNSSENSILTYNNRINSNIWNININLEFLGNFSQIGFWITDRYSTFGSLFGGPNNFKGISLLLLYNNTHLISELKQNDGKYFFNENQFFPTSIIP